MTRPGLITESAPRSSDGAASQAEQLRRKIESRSARIGIIGLGYVGLPLASTFAEKGFSVLGFDVDPSKIEALNRGRNYIQHLDGEPADAAALGSGGFCATADFTRLKEADAILICVPTPLTPQREPDMSFVVDTSRQIAGASAPRPTRRARVDDVPGNDRRARAGHPRGVGVAVRGRLLPRLLAGARGPRQQELRHRHDPEGRRRRAIPSRETSRRRCTTR